jgi:hypothetical protein
MGVFLIKDDLIDKGVVTATGLTPPAYDWENYAVYGDGVNMAISFGGYAYYALTSTGPGAWSVSVSYTTMTPGAVNVYLEPVGQETFNAATSYMLYDATHTTGPVTFTDATVTANCGVDGSDHTTWCIAARRPDTHARLAVIAFKDAVVANTEGDSWIVSGGCSLNDRGRIAMSKFKYDRTDPNNWLIYCYLDTYQLQDDGWIQVARTATPHQQVRSYGFTKTLDTSILIATDFDATNPAAGTYLFGYYVASYDTSGTFTVGPKLNVGTTGNSWETHRRSLVRLPATNDFLCVRTSGFAQPQVDLVRVEGDTVTLLDSKPVPYSSWGSSFSIGNDGDHCVAVNSSNVVSSRWHERSAGGVEQQMIQLLHYSIAGNAITITSQEYTPNRPRMPRGGAIMYPSVTGHQVETMYDDWTDFLNQNVPIHRFAFDYSGGAFTTTSLPIDQTFKTKYNDPPNYAHRIPSSYGPGFDAFTTDWTVVQDQIYITGGYYENSTDDTWILVWQVDGTTGTITAYSWSKGPMSGAEDDLLFYDDIFAFFDPPTSQLVVLSYQEFYPGAGDDWASSNRMTTYRLDYVLSAKLRSHRYAFTPTT